MIYKIRKLEIKLKRKIILKESTTEKLKET